ncbi:MAG: VOC family protein [Nitrospira sp.]|nr:VOC family protein [Nitrospira sp.]MDH4371302.1 VOC family protein [Nitrospira sp.]MDH5498877.1 VOC family protein [Nitrospira sp.]MDH5725859.1 VOC family protein [Nitrospira sp.]
MIPRYPFIPATVLWEADWFVLLKLGESELGFLLPNQPSQAPLFQDAFSGHGLWVTIEVADVDAEHEQLVAKGLPIVVSLRNEAWGDRHFAVVDPNGVGVDIVTRLPAS